MSPPSPSPTLLESWPVRHVVCGDATLSYRRGGSGPPLLLLHGWPLSSLTWAPVVPHIASRYTCIAVDLAGAGESRWSPLTAFDFEAHAKRVAHLLATLELPAVHILAQDSGATIARLLAAAAPQRVRSLTLVNTEAPGHRPPWVPLYRWFAALPLSSAVFRWLIRSKRFLLSGMGYGGAFHDRSLILGDFHRRMVAPVVADSHRMEGLNRYLRGFDWQLVDRLDEVHARIRAPAQLVWGEEDPTFPIELAERMAARWKGCELVRVPRACGFVQEERPEAIAQALQRFTFASAA